MLCEIIASIVLCCVFMVLFLIRLPLCYATTSAWWAWPGMKFFVYRNGWYSCSVGFPATDNKRNHYFITAGHCFRSDNLKIHEIGLRVYSPDNGSVPVGFEKEWVNITSDNTYLDVSLVEMYPGKRIYGSGWEHIPNTIINSKVGDAACLVGYRQKLVNCGILIKKHVFSGASGSQYSWLDMDWATYCAHPGDSGGAVYNSVGALGINVSGYPQRNENHIFGVCGSGFVPIAHVLNVLQAKIPSLHLT